MDLRPRKFSLDKVLVLASTMLVVFTAVFHLLFLDNIYEWYYSYWLGDIQSPTIYHQIHDNLVVFPLASLFFIGILIGRLSKTKKEA